MVKEGKMPIFKERLNELLEGKSITKFAEGLGMSRQTLGFYLNGDRIPDIKTLQEICKYCGVTADWLIGMPNSVKKPDADAQAVCNYTGLSGYAVGLMHDAFQEPMTGGIGPLPYRNWRPIDGLDLLLSTENQEALAAFLNSIAVAVYCANGPDEADADEGLNEVESFIRENSPSVYGIFKYDGTYNLVPSQVAPFFEYQAQLFLSKIIRERQWDDYKYSAPGEEE